MTRERAFKQAVRGRARDTGEKYTAARRALLGGGESPEARTLAEFDRQLDNLAGLSGDRSAEALRPLVSLLPVASPPADVGTGRFPFVVVATSAVVPRHEAVSRIERRGRAGFTVLERDDLARFGAIEGLDLPCASAYLLLDVDTGAETCNITPDDALEAIRLAGRSPLTIDEGIAMAIQYPEAVAEGRGFSLLGSRCGDKRVTALWISKQQPKLGWCWAGNPHTWLGSASCARRAAA